MRVLVVGGAGYIGSVVSEHLVEQGHDVIIFDSLVKGHKEAVPAEAKFVEGDLSNDGDLKTAFATKPDAMMHFAALSLVGESVQQPALYFRNNVSNGLRLLDAGLAHGVKKIVFSSTAAVYGEPEKQPIDEDCALAPTNPYGESKLAVEKILKWYSQAYGLHYASLRYFNAAGATATRGEDHSPETHLIPNVLNVAQGLSPSATIFGDDYPTADGTCVRDYIHVSDLAEAHILALHALDQQLAQIYNLGSENGFSVKQVIDVARQVTGREIATKIGARRAGDPATLVAASKRIKSALGWNPSRTDLARIIGDAWQWRQKHPSGYSRQQVTAG
jgi:UDP-glucose 4-epimerase